MFNIIKSDYFVNAKETNPDGTTTRNSSYLNTNNSQRNSVLMTETNSNSSKGIKTNANTTSGNTLNKTTVNTSGDVIHSPRPQSSQSYGSPLEGDNSKTKYKNGSGSPSQLTPGSINSKTDGSSLDITIPNKAEGKSVRKIPGEHDASRIGGDLLDKSKDGYFMTPGMKPVNYADPDFYNVNLKEKSRKII